MTSTVSSLVEQLIARGESERVEFRRDTADIQAIAAAVCAFLNSQGGTILIGVGERGEIRGVLAPEQARERLQHELTDHLSPVASYSLGIEAVAGKPCLVLEVPPGPEPPYVYREGIFVRHGARTVRATGDGISALIRRRQSERVRWERQSAPGLEIEDLDQGEIVRTAWEARERHLYELEGVDAPGPLLERMNLVSSGAIHNSAVVLFGRQPAGAPVPAL